MDNTYRFEVKVTLTVYTLTQADAAKVVQERLMPGKASDDKDALMITEVNVKRAPVK